MTNYIHLIKKRHSRINRQNNPSNINGSINANTSGSAIRNPGYSGLFLFGQVVDRTRKHVPKDNPTTGIITYTVQTVRDTKYFVDDYAPNAYYDIGSDVYLPVYIKTYKRRNGDPSYTLMFQHDERSRGEHF